MEHYEFSVGLALGCKRRMQGEVMVSGTTGNSLPENAPLILVVEDMGLQIRLIQICLERMNYRVMVARDGEEALTSVQSTRPDLIILDVEMPRLNGFQVLDRLRSQPETASIPIIMLTAHAKDANLFSEWKSDGDVFMAKPFSPTELADTVQNIFACK